jgi:hypothetical protein
MGVLCRPCVEHPKQSGTGVQVYKEVRVEKVSERFRCKNDLQLEMNSCSKSAINATAGNHHTEAL